jgi:hypothetical protein
MIHSQIHVAQYFFPLFFLLYDKKHNIQPLGLYAMFKKSAGGKKILVAKQ